MSEPPASPNPHSASTNVLESDAEASGAYLAHNATAKNVPTAVTVR